MTTEPTYPRRVWTYDQFGHRVEVIEDVDPSGRVFHRPIDDEPDNLATLLAAAVPPRREIDTTDGPAPLALNDDAGLMRVIANALGVNPDTFTNPNNL